MGRMLTRLKSTDSAASTFVWNGMDCVQETDPTGMVTRYDIPNGTTMSFVRDGVAYQCHRDALGSVRVVTDSAGAVVGTFDTDSWGNELPSTSDSVPNGGMAYRFVGGLGVRSDGDAGLYYIRHRWYDQTLQRFVSRDVLRSTNRYSYARNNPTTFVDITGLSPKVVLNFTGTQGANSQDLDTLNALMGLTDCGQPITAEEIRSSFQSILRQIPGLGDLNVTSESGPLITGPALQNTTSGWISNVDFTTLNFTTYPNITPGHALDTYDVSAKHSARLSVSNMAGLGGAQGLEGLINEFRQKGGKCKGNCTELHNLALNVILHALGHSVWQGNDEDPYKFYGTVMANPLIYNMPAILNGPLPFTPEEYYLIQQQLLGQQQ